MKILIPEEILDKIINNDATDGELLAKTLVELAQRGNNRYNRGVIHGFLLSLTTREIISGDDALRILHLIEITRTDD